MPTAPTLTRKDIFAQAWPIMLGQASIPLVGLVDATVIGRTGDAAALAAVAVGATIMNFVFWSFGFLRMGMTGLTSQADGSGDIVEVDALLLRGLLAGAGIGFAILVLQYPLTALALALFEAGPQVEAQAAQYLQAAFIGGPAALAVFALTGWMFGLGRTRHALAMQVVMNLANIVLDIWFVWGMGMGVAGVALGTAAAQWIALATGLVLATRIAGASPLALWHRVGLVRLLDRERLRSLFVVNRDIMIRTLALLAMFSWFANAGARLGATALAANQVLLQFVNMAAFILDAFAFTAEARVGKAVGARSKPAFLRSVRLAGEFSLISGIGLCVVFLLVGEPVIHFISTDPGVRAEAARFLPFAALVPLIGMPSWMLDGIFIGATRGRALRNAALLATACYLVLDIALRDYGNWGVWIAFCVAYAFRAGSLLPHLPALLRDLD